MKIRTLAGGLIAAGLAVGLAACGNTHINTTPAAATTTPAPAAAPPPTPTAPPVTAQPVATVGDTLITDNQNGNQTKITLKAVIDPAQGSDQYNSPDPGKRFVGVELTYTNAGSRTLTGDANSDISVTGSDNQTYTSDFNSLAAGTNFNDGSYALSPGAAITGFVTFQLPAAVKVVQVQADLSDGLTNAIGQWKV